MLFGNSQASVMDRPRKGTMLAEMVAGGDRPPSGLFASSARGRGGLLSQALSGEGPPARSTPRMGVEVGLGRGDAAPDHWTNESFEKPGGAIPAATPPYWTNEGFEKLRSTNAAAGPLGGSMREPFDYAAALKTLQGEQFKPKWWQIGLAAVGDALAMQDGRGPIASQALWARRDASRSRSQEAAEQILKWRHDDYARQHAADLDAAGPRTVGRNIVQYDPASGQANVVYDGPEDWEDYAADLGLKPGTPEYFQAAEDYVLRGNGPSAFQYDRDLAAVKHAQALSLEARRQGNRTALETVRQGNRRGMVDYRNANPPPSRSRAAAIVTVKSPAEAMALPSGTKFRTPEGKVKVRP